VELEETKSGLTDDADKTCCSIFRLGFDKIEMATTKRSVKKVFMYATKSPAENESK
jgi:hypothetical protein